MLVNYNEKSNISKTEAHIATHVEKLMPLECVTITKGGRRSSISSFRSCKECEITSSSVDQMLFVHIRIAGAYNSLGTTSLLSLPPLLVHKMNSPNGSRLFQFSRRCSLFSKIPHMVQLLFPLHIYKLNIRKLSSLKMPALFQTISSL